MAIPVPYYIKKIAKIELVKENWVTISIHCECGCDEFYLYINQFTKDQKNRIDQYNNDFDKALRGQPLHKVLFKSDKEGCVHTYVTEFGIIKKEIYLPNPPEYASLLVYKAKCSECGNEYILFNNGIHGYDAVTAEPTPYLSDFQYTFRERKFNDKLPRRVFIKYENVESIEEFYDASDEKMDEVTYSNGFSWIVIYAVSPDGEKTEICSEETA